MLQPLSANQISVSALVLFELRQSYFPGWQDSLNSCNSKPTESNWSGWEEKEHRELGAAEWQYLPQAGLQPLNKEHEASQGMWSEQPRDLPVSRYEADTGWEVKTLV